MGASAPLGFPVTQMGNARGNSAAQAAVQAGDTLGSLGFAGAFNGNPNFFGEGASVSAVAAQNFSAAGYGSQLQFKTTPIGATTEAINMVIDPTGYVGIGTPTPDAPLNVYDWGFGVAQIRTTNNSSTRTSGIDFFSTGPFAYGFVGYRGTGSAAPAIEGVWLSSGDVYPVIFGTATVPGPATERMRITPVGNVGIGTTMPTVPLEVRGFTTNPSDAPVTIQNTNLAGTSSLSFKDTAGAQRGAVGYGLPTGASPWAGNVYLSTPDAATPIILVTNLVERVRVDTNGNVGIGLTNPSYKLEVSGDVNASGCVRAGGSSIGGTCPSDERLKIDIKPFDLGLDALLGISPHYFRYNGLGEHPASDKPELGVIAQEVEKTASQLVETKELKLNPEDSQTTAIKQVNYTAFIYVLINAVKDLYHRWFDDSQAIHRELASVKADNALKDKEITRLKAEAANQKRESAEIKAYLCGKDPSAVICKSGGQW